MEAIRFMIKTALMTGSLWLAIVSGNAATIVSEPASQAVTLGNTAAFTVSVTGEPPFTYTWRTNYSLESFATMTLAETNCTLLLTNVTTSMAGFVWVVVEDSASTAYSQFAYLAVMTPGMETNGFRISLGGTTNTLWRVDYTTNLLSPEWIPLADVMIPRFPPNTNFVDLNATNLNRYYRVTPSVVP